MKRIRYEVMLTYGFALGIALFKALGLILQLRQATYAQQAMDILGDSLIPPLFALGIWYFCRRYHLEFRISKALGSDPLLGGAVIPAAVAAIGIIHYDAVLFPLAGIFALAAVMRVNYTFYGAVKGVVPVSAGLACVAAFVGHDLFGAVIIITGMLLMSLHTDEIYPDFSASAFVLELVYMACVAAILIVLNMETIREIAMEICDAPREAFLLSGLFLRPAFVGIPLLVIPPMAAFFAASELAQRNDESYPPFVIGALAFLASHAYVYWAVSMGGQTCFVPMELMGGSFAENLVFFLLVFMILPPDRLLPGSRTADCVRRITPKVDPDLSQEEEVIRNFMKFTAEYNKAMEKLPEFLEFLEEEQWEVADAAGEDPVKEGV